MLCLRIIRQHCPTKGEGGENRKEAAAEPYAPRAAASHIFCFPGAKRKLRRLVVGVGSPPSLYGLATVT